jgi:hypothetical protein
MRGPSAHLDRYQLLPTTTVVVLATLITFFLLLLPRTYLPGTRQVPVAPPSAELTQSASGF